jgi:hypothetical protein
MNRKIVDYHIVCDTLVQIENAVLRVIQDGWEPLGGISIGIGPHNNMECAQAMVKYENN